MKNENDFLMVIKPYGFCEICNSRIEFPENGFFEYFNSNSGFCSSCKTFDLHKFIKKNVKENFFQNCIYSFLNAKYSIFQINIEKNKKLDLNFENYGIPKKSEILSLNFTPCNDGGLFPIIMHQNQVYKTGDIPKKVTLYPAELESDISTTKVNVLVSWVLLNTENDEYLYKSFLKSFYYYIDKKYDSCILPLNIAIEGKFNKTIIKYNEKFLKSKNIESLKYSDFINTIFPLILRSEDLVRFPKEILDSLNNLRKKRNSMAHAGKINSINESEIVDYLSSAIFTFEYLQYLEKKLNLF